MRRFIAMIKFEKILDDKELLACLEEEGAGSCSYHPEPCAYGAQRPPRKGAAGVEIADCFTHHHISGSSEERLAFQERWVEQGAVQLEVEVLHN